MSKFLYGLGAGCTVALLVRFGAPWYVWVIALLVAAIIGLLVLLESALPRWPGWE